jgi:hypothetical protein
MAQPKHNRLWRPTELERKIGQAARLTAEKEAAPIPWRQLQKAREVYVDWEAFALWVRAIEDSEGEFPDWLAQAVERRCHGFSEFAVRRKQEQPENPSFLWYHLQRWIDQHIFGKAWREGWMNAVGYFAARDLASVRNHAYGEHCECQWKSSKPASYPSFRNWLKAAKQCDGRVLDEREMGEERRQLLKLGRRVSTRVLRNAVTHYLEWEAFAYWARTALEAGPPLPVSVVREVNNRAPGFLQTDAAARATNPQEQQHCRFNRLVDWIEDREFAEATKQGWFDVLLYQVRLHARHARLIDYWHDWEARRTNESSERYPSFSQWRRSADSYTFELDDR